MTAADLQKLTGCPAHIASRAISTCEDTGTELTEANLTARIKYLIALGYEAPKAVVQSPSVTPLSLHLAARRSARARQE